MFKVMQSSGVTEQHNHLTLPAKNINFFISCSAANCQNSTATYSYTSPTAPIGLVTTTKNSR